MQVARHWRRGVYLSGGFDSGAVATTAAQAIGLVRPAGHRLYWRAARRL